MSLILTFLDTVFVKQKEVYIVVDTALNNHSIFPKFLDNIFMSIVAACITVSLFFLAIMRDSTKLRHTKRHEHNMIYVDIDKLLIQNPILYRFYDKYADKIKDNKAKEYSINGTITGKFTSQFSCNFESKNKEQIATASAEKTGDDGTEQMDYASAEKTGDNSKSIKIVEESEYPDNFKLRGYAYLILNCYATIFEFYHKTLTVWYSQDYNDWIIWERCLVSYFNESTYFRNLVSASVKEKEYGSSFIAYLEIIQNLKWEDYLKKNKPLGKRTYTNKLSYNE